MSMRAQLTREVRRSPEDALSPLVLADYLEREGDKRADYLRWSHTAARSEHEDERAQGRDNLRSLLEAHEPEWSMPLPGKANWWCSERCCGIVLFAASDNSAREKNVGGEVLCQVF